MLPICSNTHMELKLPWHLFKPNGPNNLKWRNTLLKSVDNAFPPQPRSLYVGSPSSHVTSSTPSASSLTSTQRRATSLSRSYSFELDVSQKLNDRFKLSFILYHYYKYKKYIFSSKYQDYLLRFYQAISSPLPQATTLLGYLNSCLNPIIYTIFNPEFRKAFKRVLGLGH